MKIVYWNHMPLAEAVVNEKLAKVDGAEIIRVKTLDELAAALPGADGMISPDVPEQYAEKVGALLRQPDCKVRWLHVVTAGREGYEQAKLPERITVTGPAGAHSPALAEHAMAFLLAWTRQIPAFADGTARGEWDRKPVTKMSSLEGRTLGIVGLGHAGLGVAKRARPFEMKIIAANRTPKSDPLVDKVYPLGELKEMLAACDFIVVTIAASADTAHLIGAAELAVCKPNAYLVNVARGSAIEPAALEDALRTGRIAGAGIDVTEPEPLPPGHSLWSAPNLIVSPHVGGGQSPRSIERIAGRVAENLVKFINGTVTPT